MRAASREAADLQIAKTIKDEKDAIETFKAANIKITEPDIEAFRVAVWAQYKKSGLADKWKPGLADRIDGIK